MSTTEAPPARVVHSTADGSLVIPAEFRTALGIEAETPLLLTARDGALHLTPVPRGDAGGGSPWLRELYDYLEPWRRKADELGYTGDQINQWIDEALDEYRRERDG